MRSIQLPRGDGRLRHRQIELRPAIPGQATRADVGHDADDGLPPRVAVRPRSQHATRLPIGSSPGQAWRANVSLMTITRVAPARSSAVKVATAAETNTHGPEVAGRHQAEIRLDGRADVERPALRDESVVAAALERRRGDQAGRGHAGRLLQPLRDPRERPAHLLGRLVAGDGQRDMGDRHAPRIETRVDVVERDGAPDHEARRR